MTSPTPPEEKKERSEHHHRGLPRPPIQNMTDFVVFAFVSIVTFVLFSSVVGILLSIIFSPDSDRTQVIGILADITTSLISALVGFLAGKGQGHSEAEALHQKREERKLKIEHGVPLKDDEE